MNRTKEPKTTKTWIPNKRPAQQHNNSSFNFVTSILIDRKKVFNDVQNVEIE